METNNIIEINNQKGSLLNNLNLQKSQNISKTNLFIYFSACLFCTVILFMFFSFAENKKQDFNLQPKNFNQVHLNIIKAVFSISNINSKTKLINEPNDRLNINLIIDGEEKDFATEFQFEKMGDHIVEFKFEEKLTNISSLFMNTNTLKEIDLSGLETSEVISMDNLFSGCVSLEKINLNNLDTSNANSMKSMFKDCNKLKELNMEKFTTENIIFTDSMFENCYNLPNINIDYFDLTNTKSAEYMFKACYNLKEVALKNTNNKNSSSISMKSMFSNCYSLKEINLNKFEKKSVNKMDFMFNNCNNLLSIDLSKFETSQVKSISYSFSNCSSLTSLDIAKINLNNVEDMGYAFRYCTSLESIDLSNFNTTKVKAMSGLFFACRSLSSVHLNKYPINITSISDLFNGCTSLSNVVLRVDNAQMVDRVFKNCNSLKYVDLSEFNGNGIKLYVNDFFPTSALNTLIIYNSTIIGKTLERRIPSSWKKVDIENN